MTTTPPTPAADVTDEEIANVAEEVGADDPGCDFWQEFARKILALRPAPVAATGKADERAWQPIKTAPRGALCLFCNMKAPELRHTFFVDWMVNGKFCGNPHQGATHWMPLPSTPETTPPTPEEL